MNTYWFIVHVIVGLSDVTVQSISPNIPVEYFNSEASCESALTSLVQTNRALIQNGDGKLVIVQPFFTSGKLTIMCMPVYAN
jgi:hypothetical protein